MKYLVANIILTAYIILLMIGFLTNARPLIVVSGSMAPTLSKGDVVVIKRARYAIDDIISFYSDKQLVTHRVTDVSHDWLHTKGDANKKCDQRLVNVKQVVGKVIFVLPVVGYLFYYLQSNLFIYLLVIIMIVLLLRKVKHVKN